MALITPDILALPPVMFPLTDHTLNVPTDVILACAAVVNDPVKLVADTLPPFTLPVALINPVTYSPVEATTTTFPVPPTPTVTLPPELTTLTLLVPLTIALGVLPTMPDSNEPLPRI